MNDIHAILDAISQRAEAATPGPWQWFEGRDIPRPNSDVLDAMALMSGNETVMDCGNSETYYPSVGREPGIEDATFIASARTDIPALVKAVKYIDSQVLENLPSIAQKVFRDKIASILSGKP